MRLARLCEHDEIRKHFASSQPDFVCPGGEFLAEDAVDLIEQAIKDEMALVEEWPHPYADAERRMAVRILDALAVREGEG